MEHIEEQEEKQICWLVTSVDVMDFSGALTVRTLLYSFHNISQWVFTSFSKIILKVFIPKLEHGFI